MKDAVEVAKRCGAKYVTVVPGSSDETGGTRLAEGYQLANLIERLRDCAEIFEPHELVMVLEPLNGYADHGGVFLQRADQAYSICKAVDSTACEILFDIYHQQITEGNFLSRNRPEIDSLVW